MISEQLQNRIASLTGNNMAGMSQMGKGAISNKDRDIAEQVLGLSRDEQNTISDQRLREQIDMAREMMGIQANKGAISNREMKLLEETMQPTTPGTFQDDNQVINVLQEAVQKETDPETKAELQRYLNQYLESMTAPASPMAQEVKALGMGDDTELAHVRPGEVILPPEFFSDTKFESMVENKFKQAGINPEQAVVGSGIASLNEITGLPQYGFFKKIGKKLKKVVKKVAPIALPALGIAGFAGAGPLGGFLGKGAAKATTGKIFGAGGKFRTGLGAFFNPAKGKTGIFGGKIGPGIRRGIGGLFGGQQQTYSMDEVVGTLNGNPVTRADLGNMTADQFAQVQLTEPATQQTGIFGGTLGPRLRQRFLGTGDQPGVIGNILGGGQQQGGGGLFGGGFGDALKMGGIGALAAGLGKLAYEDAQKQKGVPLTPLTTMSPTGRYNIEAEIARRMGQPAPNPVEFGLLPAGTIPELSGGKPRGMMYGGGVEDLTGGMVRGLANGGGVMAFAQGGAVQMQEGGGVATLSQNNINSYIEDLSKKRQLVGNLYMKKPSRYDLQFQNATNNLQNAKLYLTPSNIAKYEKGGIDSLKSKDAKKEMNKFLNYMQTQNMQEGGEMDPSQFPRMDGDINGPGTETSDDIPAMLSDGEFVMTGRAVRGAGSYEMQADPNGIISLMPTLKEDRERGMNLMYKMMDTFANKAKAP